MPIPFVDIHCHMLPDIDDGAKDWDESLAMARLAVADGTTCVIVTPHQLGSFRHIHGDGVRCRTVELQERLKSAGVPLAVLPGADVRIECDLIEQLARGEVLTLGDRGRHVLLELPHDIYLPLQPLMERLSREGLDPILSHPERNAGVLRMPDVLAPLVEAGCLLQITAGSLCGSFGPACQQLAEWIVCQGLAHFLASDAHGARARRPLIRRAFERVVELSDMPTATDLCCKNPGLVANGQPVKTGRRNVPAGRSGRWRRNSAA